MKHEMYEKTTYKNSYFCVWNGYVIKTLILQPFLLQIIIKKKKKSTKKTKTNSIAVSRIETRASARHTHTRTRTHTHTHTHKHTLFLLDSGRWETTLSVFMSLKGNNQDIVFQQNSAAGRQRETVRHDGCTNVECFPALSAPFSAFAELHRVWIQERYACELWPSDLTSFIVWSFVQRWLSGIS